MKEINKCVGFSMLAGKNIDIKPPLSKPRDHKVTSGTSSLLENGPDLRPSADLEPTPRTLLQNSSPVIVQLDVGGKIFKCRADSLLNFPNTRLGKMAFAAQLEGRTPVHAFYDRNPKMMNSVLDFYRTGELHLPTNLCGMVLERELKYWEIPVELVHECCWGAVHRYRRDTRIIEQIDTFLQDPTEMEDDTSVKKFVRKVWLILEHTRYSNVGQVWTIVYFSMVLLTVMLNSLETSFSFREHREGCEDMVAQNWTAMSMPERLKITRPVGWLRQALNIICVFFSLELLLRFLTCPSFKIFFGQFKNWFDMALLLHNGVVTFQDSLWSPELKEHLGLDAMLVFNRLELLRVARVFYMARSFDTMKVLILSARASMYQMLLLFVCVITFVTIFGAMVYISEIVSHTYVFDDVMQGMWWAIVTMTTVGYGDIYPHSPMGRIVAALCALAGVVVLALPVAVLASAFESYHMNMGTRKQMLTRINFLADNPGFRRFSRRLTNLSVLARVSTNIDRKKCRDSCQPRESAWLNRKGSRTKADEEDAAKRPSLRHLLNSRDLTLPKVTEGSGTDTDPRSGPTQPPFPPSSASTFL